MPEFQQHGPDRIASIVDFKELALLALSMKLARQVAQGNDAIFTDGYRQLVQDPTRVVRLCEAFDRNVELKRPR